MRRQTSNWLVSLIFIVSLLGCNKEITQRNETFPVLAPYAADTQAGNWKTIVISDVKDFSVPQPIAINSANYKLEILEIKSQQQYWKNHKETFQYWAAGVTLRWNEIMRELVAKYNLPPYQNPDGSYPIPSASNPLAYPYFPFANPPYAARAYAYLSTAQYDAAIAAQYWQNVYKRPAVKSTDATVEQWQNNGSSYSYPNVEASISEASASVLSLLFPGEQAYIKQKLQEFTSTRLACGNATSSDIKAGADLGKSIAEKHIARARNDRANLAVGNPTLWKQLEVDALNKGLEPWKSLESPSRPPMLPFFGKVRGFLMDSLEVVNARPPAPYPVNSDNFKKELEEVLWYSENVTHERIKIVQYWADGAGTYTPPGHWNAIACEDFVEMRFSEMRWARNLALLNMALMDAAICCWDVKYAYYSPRPSQMNSKIKTLTGVPNFPAYTSGHSTFSGAAAVLLGHVNPNKKSTYLEMAKEASDSRLFGCIHYRQDIEVGMAMGKAIGEKAISRARIDGAE